MFTATVRRVVAILISGFCVVSLAACSDVARGGETTCGQYRAMNEDEHRQIVITMFKEHGKQDPANGMITAQDITIKAYCATAGSDSSPISNAWIG